MNFIYVLDGVIVCESGVYDNTIECDTIYYVDTAGAYVYAGTSIENVDINTLLDTNYQFTITDVAWYYALNVSMYTWYIQSLNQAIIDTQNDENMTQEEKDQQYAICNSLITTYTVILQVYTDLLA